jgi:uncharacterized protein YegL
MSNPFSAESPKNYEQKCTVALVLDISGSMSEHNRLVNMVKGLDAFIKEVKEDENLKNKLEIGIVAFNNICTRIVEPSLAADIQLPNLVADGGTFSVQAIQSGIQMVSERKAWYRNNGLSYYRPWIIHITDGGPSHQEFATAEEFETKWNELAEQIRLAEKDKTFCFLSLGVDEFEPAYLDRIKQASIPVYKMSGLKFTDFFKWLSATIADVAKGTDVVKAVKSNTSSWDSGQSPL